MRVFFSNEQNRFKGWLLAGDFVLASAGLLVVVVSAHAVSGALSPVPGTGEVAWILSAAVFQSTALYIWGLYDLPVLRRRERTGVDVSVAIVVGVAPALALAFTPLVGSDVRYGVLAYVPVGWLLVVGWRGFWLRRLHRMAFGQRVLFVLAKGKGGETMEEIAAAAGEDFEVAAVVEESAAAGVDLRTVRTETGAREIVYSVGLTDSDLSRQLVEEGLNGVPVRDLATVSAVVLGRVPLDTISDVWGLGLVAGLPSTTLTDRVRRVLEASLAGALLIVCLPLLAVIALAVVLDSPGSPLFVQHRLGYLKREFPLYKFRTMAQDAETHTGPVWSTEDDPRVTRLGSFLRNTGLDELPQLANILRGEMSFIGPRPIRRHFADVLAAEMPFYDFRFLTRPGVTGWAQVRGDYAGSKEGQRKKLEYELYYLRHASLGLDAYILLKTLQKLVLRRVGTHADPAE